MLQQVLPSEVNYFTIGIVLFTLLFVLLTLTFVSRRVASFTDQTGEVSRRSWWEWLNTPDPNVRRMKRYAPRYLLDQKVESWLCPICGSKLSKQDVHQLEIGYDIECGYCGATISTLHSGY